MAKTPSQLQQAADQVHKSGKPKMIRVRDLLSWFGAQRRGVLVLSEIRKALKRKKLVTVPDFEVAYIDQRIKLKAAEIANKQEVVSPVIVKETHYDYGFRISSRRWRQHPRSCASYRYAQSS